MTLGKLNGLHNEPGEIIQLIMPDPARAFAGRAARLRALAPGHAMGPFLEAMAHLADAQHVACDAELGRPPGVASQPGVAPADGSPGDAAPWIVALRKIVGAMQRVSLPEPTLAVLKGLASATAAQLEILAQALLARDHGQIDAAAAPFVGAALQVHWTALASARPPGESDCMGNACPVCGSPPVAGLVQSGRQLRYLACSLCAAQWYHPRLACTACDATAELSYFKIEGRAAGVRAEACRRCRSYLKLFYLEVDPGADPCADDLATIALDLLMAGKGYCRNGVNLFIR